MIEEVAPAVKEELKKVVIIMTHMFAILSLRASTTAQSHFLATHTYSHFLYTQSKGRHRIAIVKSLVGNSKI